MTYTTNTNKREQTRLRHYKMRLRKRKTTQNLFQIIFQHTTSYKIDQNFLSNS